DPGFDVLEDFLAANLQTEALTECLQRLLTTSASPAEELRQSVVVFGWGATLAAVRQLLAEDDPARRLAWARQAPAEIADEWQRWARQELLPRYVNYLAVASPKVAG